MKERFLSLPGLPNSYREPLVVTSPDDGGYNCIAWAMGDTEHFYWPRKTKGFDWPPGLPFRQTASAFVLFFKKHGFQACPDGIPEKGFEKIALFEKDATPPTLPASSPMAIGPANWASSKTCATPSPPSPAGCTATFPFHEKADGPGQPCALSRAPHSFLNFAIFGLMTNAQ